MLGLQVFDAFPTRLLHLVLAVAACDSLPRSSSSLLASHCQGWGLRERCSAAWRSAAAVATCIYLMRQIYYFFKKKSIALLLRNFIAKRQPPGVAFSVFVLLREMPAILCISCEAVWVWLLAAHSFVPGTFQDRRDRGWQPPWQAHSHSRWLGAGDKVVRSALACWLCIVKLMG